MWNTILQTAIAGTERRPLPPETTDALGLPADADFWDVAAAARLLHKAAGTVSPAPENAEEATETGENPSFVHKSRL